MTLYLADDPFLFSSLQEGELCIWIAPEANEPILAPNIELQGKRYNEHISDTGEATKNSLLKGDGHLCLVLTDVSVPVVNNILSFQGKIGFEIANYEIPSSHVAEQGERIQEADSPVADTGTLATGDFHYSLDQLFSEQNEKLVFLNKRALKKVGLEATDFNTPESLYLAVILFSQSAFGIGEQEIVSDRPISVMQQGVVLVTRNSKPYKEDTYVVTLRKKDKKPFIDPDDY